jgi:endonuclease-3
MKKPFDLHTMLSRIEKAVAKYPKAAMFQMYEEGFTSLFEQLISCIISIRTLDETTIPVSKRLFAKGRTPEQIAALSLDELAELLHGSTFSYQKAGTISGVAKKAIEEYNGVLPADFDVLTAMKGVGPKCANLALGVATQQAAISVDIHVHRVVNRWGFIQTTQPEQTMLALEEKVDKEKWIDINRLLMPFGKHICTGKAPHCSTCPVLDYCRQVGVTTHR